MTANNVQYARLLDRFNVQDRHSINSTIPLSGG
jgi:hypothetical protein